MSPKHEPPAIAATVRTILPPRMSFSHKNIGAHAANVPHDVPVAIESIAVTISATAGTSLAVTPIERAILMMEADTPVTMKHEATA